MAATGHQVLLEEHDAPSPASSTSSEYSPSRETSKRQRTRLKLSKVQSVALEAIYEKQAQTPSTARRKELAEELQISERQIRFWFQNRRAKDKSAVTGSRRSSRVSTASSSVSPASSKASRSKPSREPLLASGVYSTGPLLTPAPELLASSRVDDSPPPLAQGYDTELQDHLEESSPITVLPVNNLCVGTWKRVQLPDDRFALVSYISPSRQSLVWFVHCADRAFKMEVPFSTIIESSFHEKSPGVGEVVFILARPPIFYYKASLDPVPNSPTSTVGSGQSSKKIGGWGTCADWTENRQGTQNLLHRFTGDAAPLANLVQIVHESHTSRDLHKQSMPVTAAPRPPPSTIALPQLGSPFAMHEQPKAVSKPALQINTAASMASRQRAQMVPRSAPAHAPTGLFAYCDSVPDPRLQWQTQDQAACHAPVPVKVVQLEPPILYQASDAGSSATFNSAAQGPVMASLAPPQQPMQDHSEPQWHGHASAQISSGMTGHYACAYGAYPNYEVVAAPHNPTYDATYTSSSYPTPVSAGAMMDEAANFAHNYPTSAAGQFDSNQHGSSQNSNYYYTDPNSAYANEPTYPTQADYNAQPQPTYYPNNNASYASTSYHGQHTAAHSHPDPAQYTAHYGYQPPTY
ncbi:hypothetical protein BKA70DRAFT_1262322 [Coprinopsis sp. MPI-PUGE-AT-0042]|nr:hypothetical protein BKA70DRAFT_1262322 [Coprinopsis sp. MPI-PUGE-AT-0042]